MTAMFIRVKRKRTTYFLHCDPSECVLETKAKLQLLSDVPVHNQRLVLVVPQPIVLDECKTLATQKVVNDAVVALTLKVKGINEATGEETEAWEEVNIHQPVEPEIPSGSVMNALLA
ncbi:uncharacterized protein [Physcomitrium patens]|uniref:Ubiquitin-like domain-containing protein n=1 Tax=Physcomitrium patens TaxID=3218 RepID=A0A7I4BC00_PHYPA|nr:uncharacterized protein LOC112294813 [Physcomitrium patens]|eukprot:XP_024401451.1 uncharacterized protein LOC112294813 [Physcomitrella patens]